MRRLFLFCCLLAPLAQAQEWVSLILYNGKVWTESSAQREVEAVAIRDAHIVATGTSAAMLKFKGEGTQTIDLAGKRVLPGFNDAHVHFFDGGSSLAGPQLRTAKSKEELKQRLTLYAETLPKGEWITNGNWDHENWSPATLPDHQLIDAATAKNPVFVSRLDGHMALANASAMKLAGISKDTPDVGGGVIVRDSTGEPTGIFKDAAQELIERAIPEPTSAQIRKAILAAQAYANSEGVTSVQDMSAAPNVLRVYEQMMHAGELTVRISGHQPLQAWKRLAEPGITANFGNDMLHIGGLKGFADGSLGSTTALFFKPYLDAPQTSGIPSAELAKPDEMWKNVECADAAGLQIAIHAIGDKANNTILNFYQRLNDEHGQRDRRNRIEHAQHLQPGDIPRFGQLGVVASMQPYHAIDDGRWAAKRLDQMRLNTTYAFRSLLDAHAVLAFGSDWPVAPMSVLTGIYGAVTRRTLDGKNPGGWIPEQKITVAEAVRAYTMGSAFASFSEKVKGSIEAGKLADLVVLSQDVFAIDPAGIAEVRVEQVVFDGKVLKLRAQ